MNWYKSFIKQAQHSNVQLYFDPNVNYGNPYGNNHVEVIHVPEDPYHKQKSDKETYKRKYNYFLQEKSRLSKRTAVTAINRLAKAINSLVKARRQLDDAINSDEYFALRRLLKSLVINSDEDAHNKEALLVSLQNIEQICEGISKSTEELLPSNYNNISIFVENWIKKNDNNILRKKVLPESPRNISVEIK